ncbi:MAG: hypothetical protein U0L58_02540 [Ruminococcus sp.]|nr:hypothetical protein [Ruminococcus sp.]
MKNKLTIKLIVVIVATVALIAAIMAPVYFFLQPRMYIARQIRQVADFSDKLKSVEPFDEASLEKFFIDSKENYRVYVFDEDYNPLYSSFELGNNQKFLMKLFGDKADRFQEDSEPFYSRVDDEPAVRLCIPAAKLTENYTSYKSKTALAASTWYLIFPIKFSGS